MQKGASRVLLFWRLLTTVRNWPVYFFNRFGWLGSGDVTYKLRNGFVITSRAFAIDRSPLNDVWLDLSYEPSAFGIPFDWSQCTAIIDVGANIGTFTLYAASKAPQSRIIAVEPEPGNIVQLTKNIALNHLEGRVQVEGVAIGKRGSVTFHRSSQSSGGHSLYKHKQSGESITVQALPLTDLFTKHGITQCDFLKLDCEGGEYEALYTLPPEILSHIGLIAIEYHHFSSDPTHTPQALRAFLERSGFTIVDGKKSMMFALRSSLQSSSVN